MRILVNAIFVSVIAISLSACSGTPNCESKEASNWFKEKLSPQLNQLVAMVVTHAPVSYVIDDIETVKHNKETDSYSCKAVLRLHLLPDDNKVIEQFESAVKNDPEFATIVDNELIAKAGKDNILFAVSLISAAQMNTATLRENATNPKEVKYYFDFPVEFSTQKIKSSTEKFQVTTDLEISEANDLLNAHSIFLSRLTIAKNYIDHPDLLKKIKDENTANEAKKLKEKQDALEQEAAELQAKNDEEIAERERLIEEEKTKQAELKIQQDQENVALENRLAKKKLEQDALLKLRQQENEQYRREEAVRLDKFEAERKARFEAMQKSRSKNTAVQNPSKEQ